MNENEKLVKAKKYELFGDLIGQNMAAQCNKCKSRKNYFTVEDSYKKYAKNQNLLCDCRDCQEGAYHVVSTTKEWSDLKNINETKK